MAGASDSSDDSTASLGPAPRPIRRQANVYVVDSSSIGNPVGWAKIVHPFHPLRGKRYLILKSKRVSGSEVLSLRGFREGVIAVPLEWTDRSPLCPYESLGIKPPTLDFRCLLSLADLIDQLDHGREEVDT